MRAEDRNLEFGLSTKSQIGRPEGMLPYETSALAAIAQIDALVGLLHAEGALTCERSIL